MISNKDRSQYFGASDTAMIVGNWKTDTFTRWWLQKLGINRDHFENRYTLAGTHFEHRILESLDVPGMEYDKQIIIEDLRLRVNLDGNTEDEIYECKTYKLEKGYSLPKNHIQQVQVQMFATGLRSAKIVAYGLEEADYGNFLRPIEKSRLRLYDVPYCEEWIEKIYLPKLRYLAECLNCGRFP